MGEPAENIEESQSMLDLPDDQIDNLPIPEEEKSQDPGEGEPLDDTEAPDTSESPPPEIEPDISPEEAPDEGVSAEEDVVASPEELIDAPVETSDDGNEPEEPSQPDDQPSEEVATVDYEGELKRLFTPFRANGKDLQVHSVDDAITLMQMGANYNKKMAGLKPNLKLMKMLEKNDLLDEEKISRLIDLDKKDPAAVKQLIKDSGIDTEDLDQDEDPKYKPSTYTVNESEIDLDAVISEIKDSDTFDRTIDTVSNKWDQKSKQYLLDNPKLLGVIDDHMAKGYYETVMGIVESERMLNRLPGMSDIEAYQHVGNAIQAQGGFNQPAEENSATPATEKPVPKPRKPADPKLNDKRRAASATQSKPVIEPEFNPLNMSDEDFEKIPGSQLL